MSCDLANKDGEQMEKVNSLFAETNVILWRGKNEIMMMQSVWIPTKQFFISNFQKFS